MLYCTVQIGKDVSEKDFRFSHKPGLAKELLRQVEFMLGSRQELLKLSKSLFSLAINDLEKLSSKADPELLAEVRDLIKDEERGLVEELEEEVDFLSERMDALEEVISSGSEERADEIAASMLEEGFELASFENFIAEAEEIHRKNVEALNNLVHEIRSLIEHGDLEELSAILSARAIDRDDEENEDSAAEELEAGEGVDIFGIFEELEQKREEADGEKEDKD